MIDNDTKILVLCTGNSCRSQIAEGCLRHFLIKAGLAKAAGAVRSGGLTPHGLNPKAVEVMAEIGIDISGNTSDKLTDFLDTEFTYIITVCDNAAKHCPVFPGKGTRLHWPFEDPAGLRVNKFREVRDQIREKVKDWVGLNT